MKTVLKLLIACLVVGFILATADITPGNILDHLFDFAQMLVAISRDVFGWAGPYVLLGAFVVIPVWIVSLIIQRLRRK
ncbi:MAG: DUF6460 domain-containing protein [Pseudomonadota bacterium]